MSSKGFPVESISKMHDFRQSHFSLLDKIMAKVFFSIIDENSALLNTGPDFHQSRIPYFAEFKVQLLFQSKGT